MPFKAFRHHQHQGSNILHSSWSRSKPLTSQQGMPLLPASDFVLGHLIYNHTSHLRDDAVQYLPSQGQLLPLVMLQTALPPSICLTESPTPHPEPLAGNPQGQSLLCVSQQAILCVPVCIWPQNLWGLVRTNGRVSYSIR